MLPMWPNVAGNLVAVAYLLSSNATLISQIIRGGAMVIDVAPWVSYTAGVAAVGCRTIYHAASSGLDKSKALTAVLMASFAALVLCAIPGAERLHLVRADWAISAGRPPPSSRSSMAATSRLSCAPIST